MTNTSSIEQSSTTTSPSPQENETGSSILGCTFNFTNSIIGAGALGLGGAIASSGGLISICSIIFFGILTKLSLDMTISLTIQQQAQYSYETLGRIAYGKKGLMAVLLSKMLYSFGCLVAYSIVIKDNFGSGLDHLIFGDDDDDDNDDDNSSWIRQLLQNDRIMTLLVSTLVILPLCFLRDISSLSNVSALSIVSMIAIVVIVIYLFVANPGGDVKLDGGGNIYENWLEVRPGFLRSLGTFVFTFVCHHTVHLAYESLHPSIRNLQTWKIVSFLSILLGTVVSLLIGVFLYMTFWQHTETDIFEMYPPSSMEINLAKILLCITMMLTFPLPFVTCREMIVIMISNLHDSCRCCCCFQSDTTKKERLKKSLLSDYELEDVEGFPPSERSGDTMQLDEFVEGDNNELVPSNNNHHQWWLQPNEERQLILPLHILCTVLVWGISTALAIIAPSLGDVLNLVGCATGTVIVFVLPGLFSMKLRGYTHLAALILGVGGVVGAIGTFFSLAELVNDVIQT